MSFKEEWKSLARNVSRDSNGRKEFLIDLISLRRYRNGSGIPKDGP